MSSNFYHSGIKGIISGSINLYADTIQLQLLSSSYTFDASHQYVSDVSSHFPTGTGTTRGTVSSVVLAQITSSDTLLVNGSAVNFGSLNTSTLGSAVLFKSSSNDSVNELIAMLDFINYTPSDIEAVFSPGPDGYLTINYTSN